MSKFYLIPDTERGLLLLLCTEPLCLYRVDSGGAIQLLEGKPEKSTASDATVFLYNQSFLKLELKNKKQ